MTHGNQSRQRSEKKKWENTVEENDVGFHAHRTENVFIRFVAWHEAFTNVARDVYRHAKKNKWREKAEAAFNTYNTISTITGNPFSYTGTQSRNKTKYHSGQGVTSQHDTRLIYKKRSMPRRRKKQWKRFKSKVNAVVSSTEGMRTMVYNDRVEAFGIGDNGGVARQAWSTCALYGWRGGTTSVLGVTTYFPNGYSDIYDIMNRDTNIPKNGKVMFRTGVLDVTYVNYSRVQNLNAGVWEDGDGVVMELDVYEVWYYKDRHKYPDLDTALNEDTQDNIGGAADPAMNKLGCTPFDFTQNIGNVGMKIIKKMKYFVGNGQAVTYQIRDAKNRIIEKYEAVDDDFTNQFVKRKMTKGLLAIGKAVPRVVGANQRITAQFTAGYTRKYQYANYQTSETTDKWGYVTV